SIGVIVQSKSALSVVICPYGQKSIKNLFDNLRLFEPEIFLSRQAPKIVLMIFHDFCSKGA
ncbi:MAG: hypothetical protein K6A78_07500, partial [Prevotella sp.]|nr:hypothetical protein [Prevotella sp.]